MVIAGKHIATAPPLDPSRLRRRLGRPGHVLQADPAAVGGDARKLRPPPGRGPSGNQRFLSPLIFTAAIALICGCGGRTIVTGSGTTSGPAMSWVFDAGPEWAMAWHAFPMIDMATICAGAYHDGRLVVLCNLGGQSEVLRPSHAYVLRVEDGHILKSIGGPTGLYDPDLVITERYAYFKPKYRGQWKAFDLSKATVTDAAPPPPPAGLPLARLYVEVSRERKDGKRIWRYQLSPRYRLMVTGEPGNKLGFDLSWDNPSGKTEQVHLCELPYRIYPGGSDLLFLDDGKNLVFSWSWYLICVDVAAD